VEAVQTGMVAEEVLDRSLRRLFEARFRLGMFDPEEQVPYARIPIEVNDCAEHRQLALQAARESIVLLKNTGSFLPLGDSIRELAVIGPNADDVEVLLGNYNGTPSHAVTPLEGLRRRAGSQVRIRFARGCDLAGDSRAGFAEAVEAARNSDAVVLVLGLSPRLEGEEGEAHLIDKGGDRRELGLPGVQEELLEAVRGTGKPVVVVLLSGSALAVNAAKEHASAILATWYGGEEAGTALAEVLFGDYNPAGRLPITFYRSLDQVPPFEEYQMAGRTYRFLEDEPLFPFGFGLSYTRFSYRNLQVTPDRIHAGENVTIRVQVQNSGDRAGDEVVQLYVSDVEASVPVPLRQLQGFQRIHLEPGEVKTVSFTLTPGQMVCFTDAGESIVEPGRFSLFVGGGQPVPGGSQAEGVTGTFEVTGDTRAVPT
jgi:beta-glucosidase